MHRHLLGLIFGYRRLWNIDRADVEKRKLPCLRSNDRLKSRLLVPMAGSGFGASRGPRHMSPYKSKDEQDE
jgi:hypothetical protein